MRIECPSGCGAMLDVLLPPMPDVVVQLGVDHVSPRPMPTPANTSDSSMLAEVRAEADRTVGHAVTSAVLAHMYDCTAQADPVVGATLTGCPAVSPMGYQCSYVDAAHDGNHEHLVATDEQPDPVVVASWPNLQAVP